MPCAQAEADWWRGAASSSQKWLTITDSASGPKVLLVTISKLAVTSGWWWLECHCAEELPVVPSRTGVENGAEETAANC